MVDFVLLNLNHSYSNSLVFIPVAIAVNVATPPSLTVWLNGLTVMDNSSVQTQYNVNYYLFIIGFIAHTKLQMESTRIANKVNSVAKGL